jgi:hypothetical protein
MNGEAERVVADALRRRTGEALHPDSIAAVALEALEKAGWHLTRTAPGGDRPKLIVKR